jgi:cytochrome c-type biogenesis protein CcmH
MNPQVEAVQAKLRQIDDYQSKGLLRAEEADTQRAALMKKLMELLVPDTPAPKLPWRVRAWGAFAMMVLVGGFTAYLISGHAGLRARSEQILAQGKIAAAQDAQNRKERMERLRRGESLAPDQYGRFAPASAAGTSGSASAAVSGPAAASAAKAAPRAASAAAEAIAPLLSGRIELDPKFEGHVASDDTVFVVVRLPDDPTGLPLAQIRVEVSNLPLAFNVGTREMIGSPDRFMHADKVIVSARISKSGSGKVKPGDLVGQSAVVQPWANNVRFTIDQVAH